jgi:nucleoside-diphosphate-sugar epimerase
MPVRVEHPDRLVQPLHVDDLVALVGLHLRRPASGCFEIAGPEVVPVAELLQSDVEIVGVSPIGHVVAPFTRVLGGRAPRSRAAIDCCAGHVPIDTQRARAQFGWSPLALGIRVEQAVREALA